jgi:hypothetical protein
MPKTKRSLTAEQEQKISDRLRDFTNKHYPNRNQMNKDVGLAASTTTGWFGVPPTPPDTVSLVRLAEVKNLNLNWLLLGEGTQLRGIQAPDVWPRLRETLIAELVSHGADAAEAQRVVESDELLFHRILADALESWIKSRGATSQRPTPPRSIAEALDGFLDTLENHGGAAKGIR